MRLQNTSALRKSGEASTRRHRHHRERRSATCRATRGRSRPNSRNTLEPRDSLNLVSLPRRLRRTLRKQLDSSMSLLVTSRGEVVDESEHPVRTPMILGAVDAGSVIPSTGAARCWPAISATSCYDCESLHDGRTSAGLCLSDCERGREARHGGPDITGGSGLLDLVGSITSPLDVVVTSRPRPTRNPLDFPDVS